MLEKGADTVSSIVFWLILDEKCFIFICSSKAHLYISTNYNSYYLIFPVVTQKLLYITPDLYFIDSVS